MSEQVLRGNTTRFSLLFPCFLLLHVRSQNRREKE